MSLEVETRTPPRHADRSTNWRPNTVRSLIIDYLAVNGASKVAEISAAVTASRNCVRYHLAALERASIVRSNISPGTREGFTPFYALIPESRVPENRPG
ncbi:winged helix-turn-helix domain-containing protein [Arthrobacter sp. B6]|uniref:winged helix-turn-helix domain-containing protein n=1 Tax=Arthrobacter sp. B6 TaxID=1570137 RepID=UPI000830ED39|nr:winged helix-turn-helix domain-containing protein [Arthrobacter sp. B6]